MVNFLTPTQIFGAHLTYAFLSISKISQKGGLFARFQKDIAQLFCKGGGHFLSARQEAFLRFCWWLHFYLALQSSHAEWTNEAENSPFFRIHNGRNNMISYQSRIFLFCGSKCHHLFWSKSLLLWSDSLQDRFNYHANLHLTRKISMPI